MNPSKAVLIGLSVSIALCSYAAARADQAKSPSGPRRECFLGRQVAGFSAVSDNVLDIQVGASRYYRLSLDGSCPDVGLRNRVALRTLAGGTWICQGLDAEIIVPDEMGGQRCLVREIQPITKDQWREDGHPHH